jgi:hypothetical protein
MAMKEKRHAIARKLGRNESLPISLVDRDVLASSYEGCCAHMPQRPLKPTLVGSCIGVISARDDRSGPNLSCIRINWSLGGSYR